MGRIRDWDIWPWNWLYPQSRVEKEHPTSNPPVHDSNMAHELLDLLNQVRSENGATRLRLSGPLNLAAQKHANNMANHNKLFHLWEGGTPFSRMREAGYQFQTAGEGVVQGPHSPEGALHAWMADLNHYSLLMAHFRDVGFGRAYYDSTQFWVILLGTPALSPGDTKNELGTMTGGDDEVYGGPGNYLILPLSMVLDG